MMKIFNYLIVFILLISPFALSAQKSGMSPPYLFAYFKDNGQDGLHYAYSDDGYRWNALKNDQSFLAPMVSKDKLMRDPCIIRGADGLFHMVWTVSWSDKSIGYASSKDLVHWTEQQLIPVMFDQEGARNCWAPEITYDSSKKEYMIYWATTLKGRFLETATKGDDGYNHRMYYVTTKDFKTFSKTNLLYDPGFNVIDASIVKDGGRFVMFLKDETLKPAQKNLKVAYSKQLTGPYTVASSAITGNYWAEGPTSLKIGDEWLLYFDKYAEKKYGAISSVDFKNWKDVSEKISLPKGIRHGSVLKITAKELEVLKQEN